MATTVQISRVRGGWAGGLGEQGRDAALEGWDVAPLVGELPCGELVGGVDDGLGPVEPAGVEVVPELLVEVVAREDQFGENSGVLECLAHAVGEGGRAGVD